MSNAFDAITFSLRNLFRFNGRDDRSTFWTYAACVIGLALLALLGAMGKMSNAMAEFTKRHPERAQIDVGRGHYSIHIEGTPPELTGTFGEMMTIMNVLFGVCIGLLAAAVARRLHDTGRSGAWGLIPVPFITFSGAMTARMAGGTDLDVGLFLAVFTSNLLYVASLAYLIVLLAKPSEPSSNSSGSSKTAAPR